MTLLDRLNFNPGYKWSVACNAWVPGSHLEAWGQGLKVTLAHYCPDWDYAWIEPGEPEMECCTCQ